ncbi:MAG: hypothetical protein GTO12_10445 [Proteobacteria bacterium]|nr:hypothetical protein [Pseudomonadota bacterium]
MSDKIKRKNFQKGLMLLELLVVVNIVAILAGTASIVLAEYSSKSKCLEIYSVLPQILRSQTFHYMQHNQYYAATHTELKDYGVDLSETAYFTYSTFSDGDSPFVVRADGTGWALGGWVLYKHKGDDPWESDGSVIKKSWLPGYKDKKQPPGQAKKQ